VGKKFQKLWMCSLQDYTWWIKNIYWRIESNFEEKIFNKKISFKTKLLSRSKYKIEQKPKLLIALGLNWNTIISMMRLFYNTNLTLSNNFFQKIVKIAFYIYVIFQKRCLVVHNFFITCPNRMNQSFTCRKKYCLWENKL